MTKQEFIAKAKALYRIGNLADSHDNPDRPDWTHHSMVSSVGSNLDTMFREMEMAGVLTADERQDIYDTL